MFEQAIMKQSFEYNYRFQENMYFDGKKVLPGAIIFFSKYIDDCSYNFTSDITINEGLILPFIQETEKVMSDLNRHSAFYITPWTTSQKLLRESLVDRGYQQQFQDIWMFFDRKSATKLHIDRVPGLIARTARAEVEIEDFISIYGKVYADEPTVEFPDLNIPQTYIKALRRSFTPREVNTFHFVGYEHGQPIAIATLVYADGWGGIYNVGTLSAHRYRGIGSQISQVCIDKWKELGGRFLFLQTEERSLSEKLYGKLGFKTIFVGECWAK